jgi:hypothetical protein
MKDFAAAFVCRDKRCHLSKTAAQNVCDRMAREGYTKVPYLCPVCHNWHVGQKISAKKVKKLYRWLGV